MEMGDSEFDGYCSLRKDGREVKDWVEVLEAVERAPASKMQTGLSAKPQLI